MRTFVDISYSQAVGSIDWRAAKAWGLDLVVVRVADFYHGAGGEDGPAIFDRHIAEIRAAGLEVAVYWYAGDQEPSPWGDHRWQVAKVLENVNRVGGRFLFVAVDHEKTAGADPAGFVTRCCDLIAGAGQTPWVYSMWSFAESRHTPRPHDRLWVAWYGSDRAYRWNSAAELVAWAGQQWPQWEACGRYQLDQVAAWQVTQHGQVPWSPVELDVNVMQDWAWAELTGAQPAPAAQPTGGAVSAADQVLNVARGEIGYVERGGASNNNDNKYGEELGVNGVHWCFLFVSWVFAKAGYPLPNLNNLAGPGGISYCPSGTSYAYESGEAIPYDQGQPGDIIIFGWPDYPYDRTANGPIINTGSYRGTYAGDHVGIVEQNTGSGYVCIEGNTAMEGLDSNGIYVSRRNRSYDLACCVWRPGSIRGNVTQAQALEVMAAAPVWAANGLPVPTNPGQNGAATKAVQDFMAALSSGDWLNAPELHPRPAGGDAEGIYGPSTILAVATLQRWRLFREEAGGTGTDWDGAWDPDTIDATLRLMAHFRATGEVFLSQIPGREVGPPPASGPPAQGPPPPPPAVPPSDAAPTLASIADDLAEIARRLALYAETTGG